MEKVEGQHDQDFRVFTVHKPVIMGIAALRLMNSQTDLNLWLAGNQFFAMKKVIQQFQEKYPTVKSVGVITLPPGKEADAILKGGWEYQEETFSFEPDLYATVDMKPLQDFKTQGLAKNYFTYMHNELTLIVRKGNPKAIKGIDDLKRKDLRIYLPNPLDEGIMSVYGRKVLTQHNLWDALVGSKKRKGCQVGNVYFTEVHHREIPKAVNDDKADVGLVWKTEVENARRDGQKVEGVSLPVEDSLRKSVNYMATPLEKAKHVESLDAYVQFLKSDLARTTYREFGFISASKEDVKTLEIP